MLIEEKIFKFFEKDEFFKKILDRLDGLQESTVKLSPEALETLKEWIKESDENDAEKKLLVKLACILEHIFWSLESDEFPEMLECEPTEISNDTLKKTIALMGSQIGTMLKEKINEAAED